MSPADDAAAISTLVGEARERRRVLHELVSRLRSQQPVWDREAQTLPRRMRLTAPQRQRFRVHLLQLAQRRSR